VLQKKQRTAQKEVGQTNSDVEYQTYKEQKPLTKIMTTLRERR